MARITVKEATELVNLLSKTPEEHRPERWPSLLTLLFRWATTATATGGEWTTLGDRTLSAGKVT